MHCFFSLSLSALSSVMALAPTKTNNLQQTKKVPTGKLECNKMQKGTKTSVTAATENAHYALMERQRLKLLPRSGNGIVPQKLKLCKQAGGRQEAGGDGTGVENVAGNKVSILMPFTVLISLFTYAHNT